MSTPYDDRIALWHHWGRRPTDQTIADFARLLKERAPAIDAVLIKTHHGGKWMSEWGDRSPWLAISGPDSVDRWVAALAEYGLEFHAWCVPEGLNIEAEADRIIEVCQRAGVKSMILDVEPYAGFYVGGQDTIRPLMTRVRANLSGSFHIGLSVDSRPAHQARIFPQEWFPFVQSIHPQVYWREFGVSVEEALSTAYQTWQSYARPLYPVLQVAPFASEIKAARLAAINMYGATGLSWWQYSAVTPDLWEALNMSTNGSIPLPMTPAISVNDSVIIVRPNDPNFRLGTYDNTPVESVVTPFVNSQGWQTVYSLTEEHTSSIWARYDPDIQHSGWYEVSAFIPAQNATTGHARYKLHNAGGRRGEQEIIIAQSRYSDAWVPLGTFYFDAADPAAGVVFLNDLTGEANGMIAFDALRWRPVSVNGTGLVADGFDAPIGLPEERAKIQLWPSYWIDATGYAVRYRIGTPFEAYHTGADLNLNTPTWDLDAHAPVYAAASGTVMTVRRYAAWGNIIVICHDPLSTTGQVVYTRYAHIERPLVSEGQRVQRGDQLCSIGDAGGTQPFHLHFDVSPTDILRIQPDHWPRLDLANLRKHYVDPKPFINANRPVRA